MDISDTPFDANHPIAPRAGSGLISSDAYVLSPYFVRTKHTGTVGTEFLQVSPTWPGIDGARRSAVDRRQRVTPDRHHVVGDDLRARVALSRSRSRESLTSPHGRPSVNAVEEQWMLITVAAVRGSGQASDARCE